MPKQTKGLRDWPNTSCMLNFCLTRTHFVSPKYKQSKQITELGLFGFLHGLNWLNSTTLLLVSWSTIFLLQFFPQMVGWCAGFECHLSTSLLVLRAGICGRSNWAPQPWWDCDCDWDCEWDIRMQQTFPSCGYEQDVSWREEHYILLLSTFLCTSCFSWCMVTSHVFNKLRQSPCMLYSISVVDTQIGGYGLFFYFMFFNVVSF